MAKNKAQVNVNHYANQEEAIRKAKGNPNKNVHHKKKNSNYGGYTAGRRSWTRPPSRSGYSSPHG